MNPYIPEKIGVMKEYIPDTSNPKIKLDANESPYDTPGSVLEAINRAVNYEQLNRYPDPEMKELLSSYGRHIGVPSERIVAGDGSDELIALIINTFLCDGGKILLCEPDFSMYAFYSEFAGVQMVKYAKKDGMDIDFDELTELVKKENVKLVLFSNPCNPTGEMNTKEQILSFVDSVKALVVVDEAYMEFAPESQSVIGNEADRDNLIVLKTVSKLGLAGLRCGFAISNAELIAALKKTKSPYNLNSITQKAVAVAIDNYAEIEENINKIKSVTELLYDDLAELSDDLGFVVRKSNANFVFVKFIEEGAAKSVYTYLKDNGISVRLVGNNLRITAGTKDEAIALDEALCNYR